MTTYRVVWAVDIDVDGDHRAAAEACDATTSSRELQMAIPTAHACSK